MVIWRAAMTDITKMAVARTNRKVITLSFHL